MFLKVLPYLSQRFYSSRSKSNKSTVKVSVLGSAGGIGQPLCLLLKHCNFINELAMYDIVPHTLGVAEDLSHINYSAKVGAFLGPSCLSKALECSDVVVIPARIPAKPGMNRDDLFRQNAGIVCNLVAKCAEVCPQAIIAIITNPINSTVPLAAEVLKKKNVYDPRKLFGITTLDVIRANTFIAELKNMDPRKIDCPVIGGHSGNTIVPVVSQCKPKVCVDDDCLPKLIRRIQEAGTEVVKLKAGAGSATLAMAHAGARFVIHLIKAMTGARGIVECAFVQSDVAQTKYFATRVLLGESGIDKDLGIPPLSCYEQALLDVALVNLKKNIKEGEDLVKNDIVKLE